MHTYIYIYTLFIEIRDTNILCRYIVHAYVTCVSIYLSICLSFFLSIYLYICTCMLYVHTHITVNVYIYCAYYDKAKDELQQTLLKVHQTGICRKKSHKFQSTFEDLLKCGAKTKMASEMPRWKVFGSFFGELLSVSSQKKPFKRCQTTWGLWKFQGLDLTISYSL